MLLSRLQSLWAGGLLPPLDERLSVIAAFATDLRQLGPANFLYADSDALFAHSHKRLHKGGPHAEPPGLWTLQRHCVPTDPPPAHEAGVAIAQDERVSMLIASVPLTNEAWQPMAEGELAAVRHGQFLTARKSKTNFAQNM